MFLEREREVWRRGRVASLIVQSGAVLEGNFEFASGIISPIKIEADFITQDTKIFNEVCRNLKELVAGLNIKPDVFVGVIRGGVPFAQYLACESATRWAARLGSRQDEERKSLVTGELFVSDKALIVEDVSTTGGSISKCGEQVIYEGARLVGGISIFNYGLNPRIKIDSLTDWPSVRGVLLRDADKKDFIERVDRWYFQNKRSA